MLPWSYEFHMRPEAILVFHEFTTRPDEETQSLVFQYIGSPGHDPTKLIMTPTVERLAVSQTRKQMQSLSGHIQQEDKPSYMFIPSSLLCSRLESRFRLCPFQRILALVVHLFSAFLHRAHRLFFL